jgi:hypothetical protein
MEKTKLAVIMGSDQPLSIIIVGVGRADFDRMDQLDSDQRLLSAGGRTAKRDIVQVSFFNRKYKKILIKKFNLKIFKNKNLDLQNKVKTIAE